MGLKESILKASQLKREPVKFFGQDVFVREMTAAERDAYEAHQYEASKKGSALDNFRSRLLAKVLVDDAGNRIFGDDEVASVGSLPAGEVRRAFEVAAKLNALTPEDQVELQKN